MDIKDVKLSNAINSAQPGINPNIAMLKAMENLILFKQSLIKLTEGEIKQLQGEIDSIRNFLKTQPEVAENGLKPTLDREANESMAAANGQQH